jgi:prophage maintenance system killer protein
MSEPSNYSFHGSIIGNIAGIVQSDQISNQYNYASENKPTIAEAAAEIQQLLKQLQQTNPTAIEAEQKAFLTAAIPLTRRQKFVNALQEGGKELLKELIDNIYVNVAIAAIEGWQSNAAADVKGDQKSIQHNYNYAPEQRQTLAEAAAEIQQLLKQLQTQGYSLEAAQQKVASDLATQTQTNPTFKNQMVKWGQYLGDAAANGLIGEAVVTVLKLALRSAGIPIP